MQGFNATDQEPLAGSVLAGVSHGSALVSVDPAMPYVLVIIAAAGNAGPLNVVYTTSAFVAGSPGQHS